VAIDQPPVCPSDAEISPRKREGLRYLGAPAIINRF